MKVEQVLVLVSRIGQLVLAGLVPGIETALKIKSLFELDPDFKVNVTNLTGQAIAADDATDKVIADWRKRKGIPEGKKP